MGKNHLGRLVKVRDEDETGNATSHWVAVGEIETAPAPTVVRDGGQAIFEQSTEPDEAQPGDFWITED